MEIKVRDLLREECDVDVIDDYDESLWIAFCGPIHLSEEGERRFEDALDVVIEFSIGGGTVTARLNNEKSYVRRAVKDLFESAAGFCSESDWNKWFNEEV